MQWGNTMNHSGIRILTISPGAWPCAATPLRRCRHWWSSLEEGSSPSWTLRPPRLGRPSFSSLLPLGGEVSSSSSSSSWEECALESSDGESDTSWRRALFRVPVAFFLAFFSSTTWGAGASSPVRRASAGSSGNGAGQIACAAFFSQSCQRKGSLDPA